MADGTIKIATDVDEAGLKSGLTGLSSKATSLMAGLGKAAVAGTVAAGAAVGALVKKSVDAYSEFEQLRGGAESMFKDSSDKILEYANNGFATAQMSANQYLEIATSFSAALINDLGGDLDKAAESTDQATRVIADNWANFGGDLQMIQYTFQGFAKGNYMMLDWHNSSTKTSWKQWKPKRKGVGNTVLRLLLKAKCNDYRKRAEMRKWVEYIQVNGSARGLWNKVQDIVYSIQKCIAVHKRTA